MRLQGKNIVITGAGGGIGLVAAERFAREGAFVIGIDYNAKAEENFYAKVGKNALYIVCDISNIDAVEEAFAKIEAKVEHLDGLYNNASVFMGGKDAPLGEVDPAVWTRTLSINLGGVYHCTRKAIPLLKKKGGAIVNTASSAGVTGVPGCDAYTATKGAVVALTRSMAVEYGKYNIRVNCIAPAAILTEMIKESNLNDPAFNEAKFLAEVTPIGRWGTPEDIASLACFLCSDEGSYLNGAIIRADGGITINGNVNR